MSTSRIALPAPPAPVGAYVAGRMIAGTGLLSGQFPFRDGAILHPGRLGEALSVAQGREAAGAAALNALSQIDALLGGFDRLVGILRLDGVVASTDGFRDHPRVVDGASEVINDALGARGLHARTVIPVHRLPMDAAVELIVAFAYRE